MVKQRNHVVTWAFAFLIVATQAAAQTAAAPAHPNTGSLTLTGGVDFVNAYMFRGIRQDDTGVITWPYADLAIALHSGKTGLRSATVDVGTWNSLHTGNAGLDSASGKLWYESDFYSTLTFGFGGGVSLGTTYTAYTSPNSGFSNVKEISFKLAVDDSTRFGKAAVKPYAVIAFEVDTAPGVGQADAGQKAGRYLELGAAPGWTGKSAGLAFPTKVGLSLSNYYENPLTGVDSRFGYFSVAGIATVPLTGVPSNFGTWNLHGGVEFQALGDTTKAFNNGDGSKVIGSVGIGLAY